MIRIQVNHDLANAASELKETLQNSVDELVATKKVSTSALSSLKVEKVRSAVRCSVLQRAVVCCRVLRCVAARCSGLQREAAKKVSTSAHSFLKMIE